MRPRRSGPAGLLAFGGAALVAVGLIAATQLAATSGAMTEPTEQPAPAYDAAATGASGRQYAETTAAPCVPFFLEPAEPDPETILCRELRSRPDGWEPPVGHGNPEGGATVPAVAQPVDTSSPDKVIGNGTAASCTSAAVASAVRSGGVITFNCGPNPVTIPLTQTLYTCNTTTCQHPWQGGTIVNRMVLDGGGLVTLSGQDQRGIFYANSCEEDFGWLSATCQLDTRPQIVFQNLSFVDGNATNGPAGFTGVSGGGGGGAIAMRGGQLIVINSHFSDNRCVAAHSDAGGGAIRVTGMEAPVYIVNTTIDNNRCANGGGISSLHATVHVLNSLVTNNTATGSGASSGQGGNGGGIYFDGTSAEVFVRGTIISGNVAPEGGPGVFYVSNDRAGHLTITDSQIINNTGESFYTNPYRDIFYLGRQSLPTVTNSTVE